jgi:hypothetical protein
VESCVGAPCSPLATKVSQLPFSRNGSVEVEQEGEGRGEAMGRGEERNVAVGRGAEGSKEGGVF